MRRLFSVVRKQEEPSLVAAAAFAPLAQAQRCLSTWLEEEGRSLTARQQARAAALIARYFEHEDEVSDALILSFLRHYGGMGAVDLEDPQAVRLELKAVLDRSVAAPLATAARQSRLRLDLVIATAMLAIVSILFVFHLSQQTITLEQQEALRAAVAEQAQAQKRAPASIWAQVKRDLGVMRYQDIRRWDYDRALEKISPAPQS